MARKDCLDNIFKLGKDGRSAIKKANESIQQATDRLKLSFEEFSMSDGEAKDLFNRLSDVRERINRDASITNKDEAFRRLTQELLTEHRIAREYEKLSKQKNILREANIDSYLDEAIDNGADDLTAILSLIENRAELFDTGQGRLNAETLTNARVRILSDTFWNRLKKDGVDDLYRKGHMNDEVANKLHDLSMGRKLEDPSAPSSKIAQAIRDLQQTQLRMLQKEGIGVRNLPGYIGRQTHDPELIVGNRDTWKRDILNYIDHNRTFNGMSNDEVSKYLDKLYEDIRDGISSSVVDDGSDVVKIMGKSTNITNRLLKSRSLHFKDGASFLTYAKKYGRGRGDMASIIDGSILHTAKTTALVSRLGSNPEAMLQKKIKERIKSLKDPESPASKKLGKKRNKVLDNLEREAKNFSEGKDSKIKAALHYARGGNHAPYTNIVARGFANLRNILNMALLGNAGVRSMTDYATAIAEFQNITGVNFLESGFKMSSEVFDQLGRSFDKQYSQELADAIGYGITQATGDILTRNGIFDAGTGKMSKALNVYFKANLLEQITNSNKYGIASMLASHLGGQSKKSFGHLNPKLQKSLESVGISSKDWDVIRAATSDVQGRQVINAELIDDGDIKEKLITLYSDAGEFASPTPGNRERRLIVGLDDPNSPVGVMRKIMSQFLTFPIAINTKLMARAAKGDIVANAGQTAMLAARLAVGMTGMAYVADSLIELARGRSPKDWKSAETWGEMLIKGGAGGIITDMVLEIGERGDRALSLGPALETSTRGFRQATRIGRAAFDEDMDFRQESLKGLSVAMSAMPGQNLFYAQAAMDYLFRYNLLEASNPGYLDRLEKRLEEKGQESLLFEPTERAFGGPFQ